MRWRLEIHEELPSSSDLCAVRARAGEPEGLAVLARRQTKGRGSRGRSWESPAGNLYLSVLLRPEEDAARAGEWPLLVGVALAEALSPLVPDPSAMSLKWPNDVLLRGGKLAGILIDTTVSDASVMEALVIGIGVNLAVAPGIPGRATACLATGGVAPPAPDAFAHDLLDRLAHWIEWRAEQGFAPVREAWLARAHPVGTRLEIASGGGSTHGRFAGLAADGKLILQTECGIETLSTGEVLLAPRITSP